MFICGGAFVGLDRVIEQRIGKKTLGFQAEVKGRSEKSFEEIFSHIQPTDLIKFGLIPEFVGRLPVVATLGDLDRAALVTILTEPKNAIVKQYQRIFDYEGITLKFTEDALAAIADKATERKIGARGLRMILEDLMLDLMFQLPSMTDVSEVVITREVVENKVDPLAVLRAAG